MIFDLSGNGTEATSKSPQRARLFLCSRAREGNRAKIIRLYQLWINELHTSAKKRSNRPRSIYQDMNIASRLLRTKLYISIGVFFVSKSFAILS